MVFQLSCCFLRVLSRCAANGFFEILDPGGGSGYLALILIGFSRVRGIYYGPTPFYEARSIGPFFDTKPCRLLDVDDDAGLARLAIKQGELAGDAHGEQCRGRITLGIS